MRLDADLAARFAALTLGHLGREWPYRLDQVLTGPGDLATPAALHPIFHGSFDWHSCVHGWWQVMRLARRFPDEPFVAEVAERAGAAFTPAKVAGELAALARPFTAGFERPYGWGWLLALHHELSFAPERSWAAALHLLAQEIAKRLADYLPKLRYPVRSGKHDNTAFALVLAYPWAMRFQPMLTVVIDAWATEWFGDDADLRPVEPSGEDFLSATLCEAVLMRTTLCTDSFKSWFRTFLPDPFAVACLCEPVTVTDRSDGRLAHLDGLNLSRAWAWRAIADATPDPARAHKVADAHLAAALPHLADDYMGEHWLTTFALLAVDG